MAGVFSFRFLNVSLSSKGPTCTIAASPLWRPSSGPPGTNAKVAAGLPAASGAALIAAHYMWVWKMEVRSTVGGWGVGGAQRWRFGGWQVRGGGGGG